MEWTTIALLITTAVGVIGLGIKGLNMISERLDARKKRKQDAVLQAISDAVEIKRIQAETGEKSHEFLVTHLWKLIETKEAQIKELEKDGKLTRPLVKQLYAKVHQMRRVIESLTQEIHQEEDKIMEKCNTVKTLLDETEELLP